jgi:lysophospholipase L1-like esterase
MLRKTTFPAAVACLVIAACTDGNVPIGIDSADQSQAEGREFAHRLYAIGTSISAGTCSDGNVGSCQEMSYVAQMIRMMHREPILPLIAAAGCRAPLAAPLISFRRTSGESVSVPDANIMCSPNQPGVVHPTQNLAVPGALTSDALNTRPEDRTDSYSSQLYRRFLPEGSSQVTALVSQNPKFVIVELGANEILGVRTGVVIAGVTFVPFQVWAPTYNQVLDRVASVSRMALLVGMNRDVSSLSSLRRGSELWADRAAFLAAFNVDVNANCDNSANLLFVPIVVPTAVATGLGRRAAGLPPHVLSCAEGAFNVQDFVLTPAEAAIVNTQLVQMSDHVRGQAAARGYAFMDLEELYGLAKPPFSVVAVMTTASPHGPNLSLDGLHPSAAGQTILARAALRAIDAQYAIGADGLALGISTSPFRKP